MNTQTHKKANKNKPTSLAPPPPECTFENVLYESHKHRWPQSDFKPHVPHSYEITTLLSLVMLQLQASQKGEQTSVDQFQPHNTRIHKGCLWQYKYSLSSVTGTRSIHSLSAHVQFVTWDCNRQKECTPDKPIWCIIVAVMMSLSGCF